VSELDAYRDRLGIQGPLAPDLATLRALHAAHIRTIPFENASVLLAEPMSLDIDRFVRKLGVEGRGGFCYELNGAFAVLLRSISYEVEVLAARFHSDDGLEPPFGHMALRVWLDGAPWLVDVGAGFSFEAPLRLVDGVEQDDPNGRFRIVPVLPDAIAPGDEPDVRDVEWRHRDGVFRPHYRFGSTPREIGAFLAAWEWTRTAPESPFTSGWRSTRRLDGGWATLDGMHLRVTDGARSEDRVLGTDSELADALERWFGVRLERADGDWRRRELPQRSNGRR
jgi:N-hydroxyarylamine O-acetyltransferase